nr:MAG TPA: hypothetical protein [Podoviridae sp. ctY3D12]
MENIYFLNILNSMDRLSLLVLLKRMLIVLKKK